MRVLIIIYFIYYHMLGAVSRGFFEQNVNMDIYETKQGSGIGPIPAKILCIWN